MKIGERGQVTIPKRLRDRYGLQKDVDVEFVDDGSAIRIVKRADSKSAVSKIRGIAKIKHANTVDEYIEDIRGR